ncbi:unnamed protein product [Caenorhabditis sp. 36 PRJEB53466]|nr:unnamed protein product [Caenorhabditis sp. 36 PRJEB53466]
MLNGILAKNNPEKEWIGKLSSDHHFWATTPRHYGLKTHDAGLMFCHSNHLTAFNIRPLLGPRLPERQRMTSSTNSEIVSSLPSFNLMCLTNNYGKTWNLDIVRTYRYGSILR